MRRTTNRRRPRVDDAVQLIIANSPTIPPAAALTFNAIATGRQIVVSNSTPLVNGDQLFVQIGLKSATFELVAVGFASKRGNISVPLLATDTTSIITTKLAKAIQAELLLDGNASNVSVNPTTPNIITIEAFDDEDGVAVGTYTGATTGVPAHNPIVFLTPSATTPTALFSDVLGFLNPLDELGTTISISASSAGMLDAWIDFNDDGAFGPTEQVFKNQPLVVGDNTLKIVTPLNTVDGVRWSRFRISEFGNLGPYELAIGGEVEDHQVEIINVTPTVPVDDTFAVNEDQVLNTEAVVTLPVPGLKSLFFNDPVTGFLPPRLVVDTQPIKGTLTITDPLTGRFIYKPFADFHGQDTFTYWVSTQPVPGTVLPPNVQLATVTINVVPVNDAPLATDKLIPALEDTPVTITAAQLLVGAIQDASPQYPTITAPTAPWNENNQKLTVVSVTITTTTGVKVVTAANAATGPFVTTRGSFVVNFTAGILTNVIFTPALDLNRDNLRAAIAPPILQTFLFTIQDSGESIDPDNGSTIAGTPLQHTATTSINVAPRNDTPTTNIDLVTIGPVGTTVPTNTVWNQFHVGLGQATPIPTEDTTLVIPSAFLLQNDLAGSITAGDENTFISNNDRPLTITSVSVNFLDAAVSINASGNIVFVPPKDAYGDIVFTYVVTDTGIDESLTGIRTVVPRTAVGTVTVTVQAVNDVPVTFDRSFTVDEVVELGPNSNATGAVAQLPITSAQLLNLTGTNPAIPGVFLPTLIAPYNESEQALRVVAFADADGQA